MVGQFLSVMNMSVTHSVHYIFLQCGWAISVRSEHVCDTLSALYFSAVQLSEVIVTRRETALSSDVMCDASGAAPACLERWNVLLSHSCSYDQPGPICE